MPQGLTVGSDQIHLVRPQIRRLNHRQGSCGKSLSQGKVKAAQIVQRRRLAKQGKKLLAQCIGQGERLKFQDLHPGSRSATRNLCHHCINTIGRSPRHQPDNPTRGFLNYPL